MKINPILVIDSYKLAHISMYPEQIKETYLNLTPRVMKYFQRLVPDEFKYDNKIVAFGVQMAVTDLVKKAKAKGHTICIWTANTQPTIVKLMLAYQGIPYDLFNNSPIMNERRKPHFNILLDDIAGLNEAYHTLDYVLVE